MPAEGIAGVAQAAGKGESYAAFISYSHADEAVANWLHRRLESYRIPKGTGASRPNRRLGKIFRDRVELATSHDLSGDIRRALDASAALILLCSPRSAKSPYVAEEIRRFKETGKGERIFALIVDGEPHAAGKPGRSVEEECFPNGLLYQVGEDGQFSSLPEPREPIAADIREGKDGRESGALKIVAGLLGVGLDVLVQREKRAERARRTRLSIVALVMTALALVAVGGGGFAWWLQGIAETRLAEAERQTAVAARRVSEAIAREADIVSRTGDFETAELMALYADPAAQKTELTRRFDGVEGYASARATLASIDGNQHLITRLNGHTDTVNSVAFAPDGKRAATVSNDLTIRIWDTATGKELRRITGSAKRLAYLAFSPDGRRIATASWDHTVVLWDADTGERLTEIGKHDYYVHSVAFSPDGKRIFTGERGGKIWDATTGKLLVTLENYYISVDAVAFSSDGQRIVTGTADTTARIWDANTGKLLRTLRGHDHYITSVAFSPDDSLVVTAGSLDNSARLWDASTGAQLEVETFSRGAGAVAFSPDGKTIAIGTEDGILWLWDLASDQILAWLQGHTDDITSLAFSKDGSRLLSGSWDLTARVWDVRAVAPQVSIRGYSAAVSPDGESVVGSGESGRWGLLNLQSGAIEAKLQGPLDDIRSFAFSPDGQRLVAATEAGTGRIWDASSGEYLFSLAAEPRPAAMERDVMFFSAEYSPDNKRIVTADELGRVRLWDASDGKLLKSLERTKEGDVDSAYRAVFSPDGRRVLAAVGDMGVFVWDANSGEQLLNVNGHTSLMSSLAVSPDGSTFVSGSWDGTARMWDMETGKPLLTFPDHGKQITDIAFSSDGRLMVTGAWDSTARLWDVESGKSLMILGHPDSVNGVAFHPDGKRLLTNASDGFLRVWAVPDIVLSDAGKQVESACRKLWTAHSALAFQTGDALRYPILRDELEDPDNPGFLISPCKSVLPPEAFIKLPAVPAAP